MESFMVHFDQPTNEHITSEPTGVVEDMKNRVRNSFSNTQELMLLLGQFDSKRYPWQRTNANNN